MGIPEFAARYGVKERTVSSWRYGERFPSRAKAQELVALSGGELTMAIIYAPTPAAESFERAA